MSTSIIYARNPATQPHEVPFYNGAPSFRRMWPRLREHLADVMETGKYSHGIKVGELERAIERYTGARHAIGVGNGTDALILLLRASGIGPGADVVVPCFTFIASATSVVHAGARPVFADIDPDTYGLDPAATEQAITSRTKAIMPAHLFAQMADMDALNVISRNTGVPLIEDSAEAMGMWWDGVHAGLLGVGGVLSFFPTKTLAALGDAGMVLTDDDGVADRVRILRHHGRLGTTIGRTAGISNAAGISGTNSKMDETQAAVVLARLEQLPEGIARRAALAKRYDERLSELDGFVRAPRIAGRRAATNAVYYAYVAEFEQKSELRVHLAGRGIDTEEYYPRPLHLQPCFAVLGYREGQFPVAERVCKRTLALPMYPDLTFNELDYVCRAISEFYEASA